MVYNWCMCMWFMENRLNKIQYLILNFYRNFKYVFTLKYISKKFKYLLQRMKTLKPLLNCNVIVKPSNMFEIIIKPELDL